MSAIRLQYLIDTLSIMICASEAEFLGSWLPNSDMPLVMIPLNLGYLG